MRTIPTILAGLLTVSACQPILPLADSAVTSPVAKASIRVGIRLGSPFVVQAGPKVASQVANLTYELLDADSGDSTVAAHTQAGTSYAFSHVADGHYKIRVTARDADNQVISQGAPTSGVIEVAAGVVTYPGGAPSLTLTVPLLDGDGEKVSNQVTLSYAGGPVVPDRYEYKLIRTSDGAVMATHPDASKETHFAQVPPGEFSLTVEAFDAANNSITEKGPQTSSNTVSVVSGTPSVSYTGGLNALTVSLRLFINKWEPAIPWIQRTYAAAVEANGEIYVVGGYGGSGPTGGSFPDMAAYDPASNSWTPQASMTDARMGLAAAVLNGTIYAIGGGATSVTNQVEAYTIADNSWTTKASMTTRRGGLAAAVVNGKIYVFGGRNENHKFQASVEAYSPDTDQWQGMSAMPTARQGAGAAVVDGIVYVIGGSGASGALTTVEAYNPTTDTWETKAPMPTARHFLGIAPVNGRIYVMGGVNSDYLDTVEEYDPATNTWSTKAAIPEQRGVMAAAAANGKIYLFGGENDQGFVQSIAIYAP